MTGRRWELEIPVGRLRALNLNVHAHRQQQATLSRRWRQAAWAAALEAKLPKVDHAQVQLHLLAPDRRRRDADNLAPTSKAVVDGLRDAGVLPDDSTDVIDHLMPAIHPPSRARKGPRWVVVIVELTEPTSARLPALFAA